MKKNQLLTLLLTIFVWNLQAQVSLYDDSIIHEIKITSTDANLWQNLSDDYDNTPEGGDIPYRSVTLEIDGNVLNSVGIRQKGFASHFTVSTTKKPLKINFGKFVDGQKYEGVKKINLGNGVGDPAIAKDKLAYDMFRHHGIPSPRVAHAKVYIQGQYWGTYSMVEQIDKRYLKRNFADNDGNLWKNKGNTDLTWQGPEISNYPFELQTNEDENDWSKFIEFVNVVNNTSDANFKTALENIFHVDEYLRILAIDLLINNWDSYVEHGRNWYLYHEPKSNKIHWLPWDYNLAFDRETGGDSDLDILNAGNNKVLINRVLAVPEWRAKYLSYMCEILQVNMTNDRINSKLDLQLSIIDNAWDSSNNFFTLTDINNAINGTTWTDNTFDVRNFQGLKKFIQDRAAVMQNNLAAQSFNCVPLAPSISAQEIVINEFMSSNGDGSEWVDQDNENEDWIELYNNTSSEINLSNYFLSDDTSFYHKWEFPEDISIPANGYLIVWPDKDVQQNGLHTQFKLDKKKGKLFLTYLDGSIIDSAEWTEEMTENTSLSRIPNGTGDFQSTSVTHNAMNTTALSIDEHLQKPIVKLYPNPTSDILNIDLKNTDTQLEVTIIDLTGRQVHKTSIKSENKAINVSGLKSGMYIVSLKNEGFSHTQKVIIR